MSFVNHKNWILVLASLLTLLMGSLATAAAAGDPAIQTAQAQQLAANTQTTQTTQTAPTTTQGGPTSPTVQPLGCPTGYCMHGFILNGYCTYYCTTVCPSTPCQ